MTTDSVTSTALAGSAPAPAGRKAWAKAFAKAQSEFKPLVKNKEVSGSYSYKYAELSAVHDAVLEAMTTNGLSHAQDVTTRDSKVAVATRIYHIDGWVEHFGPLEMSAGQNHQQAGGAITYARRYALCAALGIAADEDTDAQGIESPPPPERRRGTKPPKVVEKEKATLREAIEQAQEDKPKPLGPAAIAGAERVVAALVEDGNSVEAAKQSVRGVIAELEYNWSDLAHLKVQDEVIALARNWLIRVAVTEAEGA